MSALMKPPSWLGRVASKLLLDTWHEKFGRSTGTIFTTTSNLQSLDLDMGFKKKLVGDDESRK